MHRILIFVMLFYSCHCVLAQQLMFQKKIGGPNWEYAYAIQKTTDSGYVLGGTTSSFGAGGASFDLYVVKLAKNGDTVWTRTYGGSCTRPEVLNDIYPTQDGGFVITGYTCCWTTGPNTTDVDAYIIRIKGNGDTLWTKHWGGLGGDDGYGIIQDNAGNILVTGNESSFGSGMLDAWLTKLNSAGDTIWNKTYGGAQDDWGYGLLQTKDGGYAIGGYTQSFGAGGKDMYLVKTDVNGNLQWSKTYGGSSDDEAYGHCIQQTKDKGFILVGSTLSYGAGMEDIFLVKTDSVGNLQWAKVYGGPKDDFGHAVQQTKDGGYVIAGFTKSFGFGGGNCNNAFLLKTDSIGNIKWSHVYGGNGKASTGSSSADGAYGLVIANDGGFVLTGLTNSWGANANDEDMYVIKTDTAGNSNCISQKDTLFTATTVATIVGTAATIVKGGGQVANTGTIVKSGGIDSFICFTAAAIDTGHTNISNTNLQMLRVQLFPNPANGSVFLAGARYAYYELIDINGRRLRYGTTLSAKEKIEINGLNKGMYFIKVRSQNESVFLKLLIE